MKERPTIMSGDHPKLILDGLKTMTRRVITQTNSEVGEGKVDWAKFCWDGSAIYNNPIISGYRRVTKTEQAPLPFVDGKPETGQYLHVPYRWEENQTIFRIYPKYEVGDRLWVRETFSDILFQVSDSHSSDYIYKADWDKPLPYNGKWKPSIHLPRWASRILLEITEIRAERLQDITVGDCYKEGAGTGWYSDGGLYLDWYKELWDSLNAKRGHGWEANPWVFVIEFKRIGL